MQGCLQSSVGNMYPFEDVAQLVWVLGGVEVLLHVSQQPLVVCGGRVAEWSGSEHGAVCAAAASRAAGGAAAAHRAAHSR